jgi:AraC-like DNA-binding protein
MARLCLEAGYDAVEAFSRAFSRAFGLSTATTIRTYRRGGRNDEGKQQFSLDLPSNAATSTSLASAD